MRYDDTGRQLLIPSPLPPPSLPPLPPPLLPTLSPLPTLRRGRRCRRWRRCRRCVAAAAAAAAAAPRGGDGCAVRRVTDLLHVRVAIDMGWSAASHCLSFDASSRPEKASDTHGQLRPAGHSTHETGNTVHAGRDCTGALPEAQHVELQKARGQPCSW